jgi:uncharacterized membrane protein YdbT with pleckstrin-like domain
MSNENPQPRPRLLDPELLLTPEEEFVVEFRQAAIVLLPAVSLGVLLVVLPFFFLYPLLRATNIGIPIIGLSVSLGLLQFSRVLYCWRRSGFILTSARLIDYDQQGLFRRSVAEIPIRRISDVQYSCRFWQTILRVGDITVSLANRATLYRLTQVKKPREIQQKIMRVIQRHQTDLT